MTTSITIKDSAGIDREFTVIRQPSGNMSAILVSALAGAGMNRTAFPKIELSGKVVNGRTEPVATIAVPYGALVDGAFVKKNQVTAVARATQPADAPELARADAEAFARNLMSDPQVMAMFQNGTVG